MDEMEVRSMDIELRSEDTKDMIISGYAITFNSESRDLGGFKEIIDKRALDNLDLSDVALLYQHKPDDILASSNSKTMTLQVTEKGLYFRAELANTQLGRDTYELIKRGDLKSMSFGFNVEKDDWNVRTTPHTRNIRKIKTLKELSIVTFPAYKSSSVAKRMLTNCTDLNKCMQKEVNQNLVEAKELLKNI